MAVIFVSALVPALSLAQPPRARVSPPSPPPPSFAPSGPSAISADDNKPLDNNITIRLFCEAPNEENFDLEIIGSGPSFNVRQAPVTENLTVSCFYQISNKDESYKIKYQITIRAKIQTNHNTEYIETSIEGDVLCKDGEPVTLLKTGNIPLKIVINPKQETSEGD